MTESSLRSLLARVVPGSVLREGLERILRARMGALIVLGDGPDVLGISSGGFHIDAEMTAPRLSELAKMDGAILLDRSGHRVAWANVHLVPDPAEPTSETGMRHRSAERVARQTGVPVVAVSEEMGTITLYQGPARMRLEPTDALVGRANHLLQILERFTTHFSDVRSALEASELEDVVTVRDVATALQRAEMVARVAAEIAELLIALGEHGDLLRLQLDELLSNTEEEERLLLEDYLRDTSVDAARTALAQVPTEQLLRLESVVDACFNGSSDGLDGQVEPRGVRLLRRLPQLPAESAARLVEHFGDAHRLMRAPIEALVEATGMSEEEARTMKAGIARLAESSLLGRLD